MIRQPHNSFRAGWSLLAVLTLGTLPAFGEAAGIGFKNELNIPIVVQGESIVNGTLRRGQPLLIQGRKMAFDANVPAGPRQITIYDANQPSRVLARFPLQFDGKKDKGFAIISVPGPPGAPPKLELKPIPFP